jgi:glycosyltransferase involved in cell wall biosynthesis
MSDTPCETQSYPMTVVMATLGGDSLRPTIEHLNRGSIIPDEILVCIPADEAHRVRNLSYPNMKVIVTDCRGQVAQRAIGFQNTTHDLVMQLDDDILVDERCVEYLLKTITEHRDRVAVGPVWRCSLTNNFPYERKKTSILSKLYYWVLNGNLGLKYGKITKAGTEIGTTPHDCDEGILGVDWLPGGCVFHKRENLILENFYPFEGKSFCEDLFHGHFLNRKGVGLVVNPSALCWFESIPSSSVGPREFSRDLISDCRARRYFVRLTSRSIARMYFYYFVRALSYGLKKTVMHR